MNIILKHPSIEVSNTKLLVSLYVMKLLEQVNYILLYKSHKLFTRNLCPWSKLRTADSYF